MENKIETLTIVEEKVAKERFEYIQGLRDLATYLESNPEFKLPRQIEHTTYIYSKDDFTEAAKEFGPGRKIYTDWTIALVKDFGPHYHGIYTSRNTICEMKITGKKIVPATASIYIPEVPEHEEDIVEWECKSILGDDKVEDRLDGPAVDGVESVE